MAKRLILIAIIILGCTVFPSQNLSQDTYPANPDASPENTARSKNHRYRPPYKIVNSRYVSRSSIKRNIGQNNGVRISLKQNGIDNTDIEDFSLAFNSGNEYRMGNMIGIENSSLPLYVKVTYRSWNTFHAVQVDVIYEFMIFSPGTWDVMICN
jgi:hypothetical protein